MSCRFGQSGRRLTPIRGAKGGPLRLKARLLDGYRRLDIGRRGWPSASAGAGSSTTRELRPQIRGRKLTASQCVARSKRYMRTGRLEAFSDAVIAIIIT